MIDEERRKRIEECVDQLKHGTATRLDWLTVTEFYQFMQELANERRESQGDPEGGLDAVRGSPDNHQELPAPEDDLHAAQEDEDGPDTVGQGGALPAGEADAHISDRLDQAQGSDPDILQQPQGETTMKSGIKTTEFWLSLAATLLGLLVSLGLIGPEDMDAILKVLALILGFLPLAAYNLSRGLAKMGRDD